MLASCKSVPLRNPNVATVQFVITVPEDTPSTDTIYLSGNVELLGNWNGRGLALSKRGAREHVGSISVARGTKLEYKVTRGSWDTVEKEAGGAELANRTLTVDHDVIERITVAAWRDTSEAPAPRPSTITGDVRYHDAFASRILGNSRRLIVWLPPGYDANPSQRYPVLYMHDGQNVFDDATSFAGEWRADETAARLIAEAKIEPIIIVGIENAGDARVEEYTPTQDRDRRGPTTIGATTLGATTRMVGGHGERYAQFLITEVKPFIDSTYRTLPDREHAAVCGSSLGGLISLYLAWKHNDVFGLCGAVSPSLWWSDRDMLVKFEVDSKWMKRVRIWADMGTDEGVLDITRAVHLREAREFHAIMARAGLKKGRDFEYREFDGAEHNEQAWSARFDQVLMFLFGKQ